MTSITQIRQRGLGKALIVAWGLALLILIGLPLLGYLQQDFLGHLAFGFLISSALLNLSIIISYKVECGSTQIAKGGWVGLGVVILGFTLYLFDGQPNSDIAVFLGWAMLVHSFPSSLIVSALIAGISYFLNALAPEIIRVGYIYLCTVWMVSFVAGYFQWFKVIPFFITKLRRK